MKMMNCIVELGFNFVMGRGENLYIFGYVYCGELVNLFY